RNYYQNPDGEIYCEHRFYWTDAEPNHAPSISVTNPAVDDVLDSQVSHTFRGSATDHEEGTLTDEIHWFVNEQAIGTGGTITHTFTSADEYVVTATVIDSEGERNQISRRVFVRNLSLCDDTEVMRNGACVAIDGTNEIESAEDGDPECNGISNPVNITNGNKFQREVDFVALGEAPLHYSRSYNSKRGTWLVDPRSRMEAQFVRSKRSPYGVQKRVDWITPDGKRVYFYSPELSDNEELPELIGAQYTSTRNNLKLVQLTTNTADPEYYVLSTSTQKLVFSFEGVLHSVEFDAGIRKFAGALRHTYHQEGDVLNIRHSNGSSIELTFRGDQIQSMRDTWGNLYSYVYEGQNIKRVYYPDNDSDPDNNPYREYLYTNPTNPHLLTGIIDAEGKVIRTWDYDSLSRVVSSIIGKLSDHYEFNYFPDRTEVTRHNMVLDDEEVTGPNRDGSRKTVYHYTTLNGQRKISRIEGQPSKSCGATYAETTYDANGFVDVTTDFDGDKTQYEYNSFGQLEEITEGFGTSTTRTTAYRWHPEHFGVLTSLKTPNTEVTITYENIGENQYTETHRVKDHSNLNISVLGSDLPAQLGSINTMGVDTASKQITYEFYPETHVLKSKTVKMFLPDTAGYLASEVAPHFEEYYNENGQLTRVVMEGIRSTDYHYDPANPYGHPEETVDQNGVVTRYAYHPRGWVTEQRIQAPAESHMADSVTTFNRSDNGLLSRVTLPDGYRETYGYLTDYQKIYEYNNRGESKIHRRLSSGGSEEMIYWVNGEVRRIDKRKYNEMGELAWSMIPDDSDNVSNSTLVAVNDFDKSDKKSSLRLVYGHDSLEGAIQDDDRETITHYDVFDQVDYILNAKGNKYDYTFDDGGNLRSIEDPSGVTNALYYDGLNRLRQSTLGVSDHYTQTYWYNPLGNVIYMLKGNSESQGKTDYVEYRYEHGSPLKNLALLTEERFSDGSTVQYFYDDQSGAHRYAKGRLYRVIGKDFQTDYDYHHLGLIVKETKTILGRTFVTEYRYDAGGNLEQMIYPSGRTVTYGLDKGQVREVSTKETNLVTNILYEPFSQVPYEMTYVSGDVLRAHYNYSGNMDQVSVKNDTRTLMDVDYRYDHYAQISEMIRQNDDPLFQESVSLEYDKLSQLTGYRTGSDYFEYHYDDSNNRLFRHHSVDEQLVSKQVKDQDSEGELSRGYRLLDGAEKAIEVFIWGPEYGTAASSSVGNIKHYSLDSYQRIREVIDFNIKGADVSGVEREE
ncbi:MAG: DUF6531 domain-containing protein, partial [Gammaproteobacteria bacterium]